jgi:hypothetical protein
VVTAEQENGDGSDFCGILTFSVGKRGIAFDR